MEQIIEFLETKGILLVQAVVVLILGIFLIKLLNKILKVLLLKSTIDNSITSFVISLISLVLYVALVYVIFTILDISTTGFIAALSAIALAVSLALQNTLSNLASGFVIIFTKPFKQGDFIQVGDLSGSIKKINFFNTQIVTRDNKVVVLPNNSIINSNLINYNKRRTRRVELIIPVSYGVDLEYVKSVIENVVVSNPKVIIKLPRTIRLMTYNASSLDFAIWCWCNSEDYWDVYFGLNEEIYVALAENNITIPFNQLDVHLIESTKVQEKRSEEQTRAAKKAIELKVIDKKIKEQTEAAKKVAEQKKALEAEKTVAKKAPAKSPASPAKKASTPSAAPKTSKKPLSEKEVAYVSSVSPKTSKKPLSEKEVVNASSASPKKTDKPAPERSKKK